MDHDFTTTCLVDELRRSLAQGASQSSPAILGANTERLSGRRAGGRVEQGDTTRCKNALGRLDYDVQVPAVWPGGGRVVGQHLGSE
jgi:hypothetical protein